MSILLTSRLRFFIASYGWPAAMGVALILASLPVFWLTDEMTRDVVQLNEQLRVQRQRALSQPTPVNTNYASLALAEFRRVLPDAESSLNAVDLLHSSAATHDVQLASGEYRVIREGDASLQRYQITLPASGTYPALRAWLADGVNAFPTLALDEVSFARQSVENPVVEARVRWVLYFARPR